MERDVRVMMKGMTPLEAKTDEFWGEDSTSPAVGMNEMVECGDAKFMVFHNDGSMDGQAVTV